ncbi:MAG: anhydro-N-acetylmuramic acid kinase [Candidatus Kapaibacteriales bacterium]
MILNTKWWLSEPRIVAGVMTGTSLDSIDIAVVRFFKKEGRQKFSLVSEEVAPISEDMRQYILDIIKSGASAKDFSQLGYYLAEKYAENIEKAMKKKRLKLDSLDAVGIHGQTIWHQPEKEAFLGSSTSSTFQIGNGSVLANIIGKPVVSDFRAADVALGGQGAPLVPIFDDAFLSEDNMDVIALNIGGISNITYMPAKSSSRPVTAFDTGPGNMLIDWAMKKLFNKDYDHKGETAQRGWSIEELQKRLHEIEYIHREPPKSTGRELFSGELIKAISQSKSIRNSSPPDIVRTLTEFTAWSIATNIERFANPEAKIIVSGGGTKNSFLMQLIKRSLPQAEVVISDTAGISSDQKEAVCFAYLAYRTLAGMKSNIPNATGAKRSAVLGSISIP